jgi:hypothetical protein
MRQETLILKNASFIVGVSMNAYCVVLCRCSLSNTELRTQRFYLRASTPDQALAAASYENPQWRVLGIEPGCQSRFWPQSGQSQPTPDISHAA